MSYVIHCCHHYLVGKMINRPTCFSHLSMLCTISNNAWSASFPQKRAFTIAEHFAAPKGRTSLKTGSSSTSREVTSTKVDSGGTIGGIFGMLRGLLKESEDSGGITEAIKSRFQGKIQKNPEVKQAEFYQWFLSRLMAKEGLFTFRRLLELYREVLDETGYNGIQGKFPWNKDNPNVKLLLADIKVLEAMLPQELDTDDPRTFTRESKALIAEAAGTTVKSVSRLILTHDVYKTDRTWFMRRILFGKPLPKTLDDRDYEAKFDRPGVRYLQFGDVMQTLELRAQQSKATEREKNRTWIPKDWPWVRRPTSGVDRWRTTPYTKGGATRYFPKTTFIPKHYYLRNNPPAKFGPR